MRREDRSTYATAVWETFRERHQPTRFTMTSSEFNLVSRWMDANVPLAVVLEGLHGLEWHPKTLLGCERAVGDEIARWARTYTV